MSADSPDAAPTSEKILREGEPGTVGHVTANMFAYSFKARMVATGFIGRPTVDTGYRPTGCACCCCNMCPISLCGILTGKVDESA